MPFRFGPHSPLIDEAFTLELIERQYRSESIFGTPFLRHYETSLDATNAGINPAVASKVAGDFAECGVYKGSTARLLVELVGAGNMPVQGRQFHLFDSYEGLPPAVDEDAINYGQQESGATGMQFDFEPRRFADTSVERVKEVFAPWPWVQVQKGWIPEVLAAQAERRFAFVHVDVDMFESTRACLEFFVPRMSPGGIILCDDYKSTKFPGAKRAWDEFCRKNGLRFAVLDNVQAALRI